MRMMNILWFFVAVALCAVSGVLADGTEKIRVACVGDSITFGVGAGGRPMQYPAQLATMLGGGWEVEQFGKSGATLLKKGRLPYWNSEAHRAALAFNPNVVVIMLGTNDSGPQNWIHKADYVADYVALIEGFRSLESKPDIWICYPVPAYNEQVVSGRVVEYEIIHLIDLVAAKTGAGIIDLHSALDHQPDLFPDTVHPNAAGHKRMAQTVAKALRER